jgi:hypothetical protein
VPATHDSIAAALLDDACPTVFVLPGTYTEILTVARDVVIEATGDGDVTIDAAGAGTAVTIVAGVDVTLRGITVTGGSAVQGGGIRNAGALLLDDVIVRGNEASGSGGGVFSIGDTELRATSIEQNLVTTSGAGALGRGGGIWLQGAALVIGEGSRIVDNTVSVTAAEGSGAGGGIFARISTVTLGDGTLVQGNTVSTSGAMGSAFGHVASGGGIAVSDSTVVVGEGVDVIGNVASAVGPGARRVAEGGGLFMSGGSISGGSLVLDGNIASATEGAAGATGGGALFSDVVSIDLVGLRAQNVVAHASSVTAEEEAEARGGAVCVLASTGLATTVELVDVVIEDATALADVAGLATARGGGLLLEAQSGASIAARMQRVAIVNARADGDAIGEGGGLAVLGGEAAAIDLAVVNATFSGGSATGSVAARGAAIGVGAPLSGADVSVELRFVTAGGSMADLGGAALGVWADAAASAEVLVAASILDDLGAGAVAECSVEGGSVISGGDNLLGGTCAAFGGASDVLDADPMLAALVAEGDHFVHVPEVGSVALDLVDEAGCVDDLGVAVTVDQRGMARPVDAGCDAGAVELQ